MKKILLKSGRGCIMEIKRACSILEKIMEEQKSPYDKVAVNMSLKALRKTELLHKIKEFGLCPVCSYDFGYEAVKYCPNCGTRLEV